MAILSAVFFAFRFPLVRKATVTGRPVDAAMASMWVTAPIFLFLSFLLNYPNFGLDKISFISLVGSGILVPSLGLVFMYEGIKRVGASRTAPITRGSMIINVLIGLLFLGESVTSLHFIGIISILFGVVIVSYEVKERNFETGPLISLDLVFPFAAFLFFGFGVPLMKVGISRGVPIPVAGAVVNLTAFIVLSLFFLWRGRDPMGPIRSDERFWYFGAGLTHFVAVSLFWLAISISPIVVVIPFRSMSPLFVLLYSFLFLKRLEKITKMVVLGSALTVLGGILAGIYM